MKLFCYVKRIINKSGEEIFTRFAIFECSWFAIYVHKFITHDRDPYHHSHPWNFASFILKGGYVESRVTNNETVTAKLKTVGRFELSFGSRNTYHKVTRLLESPSISLFFTFGKRREWNYILPDATKVSNSEFRKNKDSVTCQTTKQ